MTDLPHIPINPPADPVPDDVSAMRSETLEARDDFSGADGPFGGWSPLAQIQPGNYMTITRQMNIHDFLNPEEGGYRLVDNLDSARAELQQFMEERGLRLTEPFDIRIFVEVTASTEPVPTDG